jgi:hypothetical protein
MRNALRVRRPGDFGNAKRSEQLVLREFQRRLARGLLQDRRKQVHPGTAVGKDLSRLGGHRKVKRELHPIGARVHLVQRGLVMLADAGQTRNHARQVPHRDAPLPVIRIGNRSVSEEIDYRLVKRKLSLRRGNRDQSRHHALRHRGDVMGLVARVGIERRVEYDAAVHRQEDRMGGGLFGLDPDQGIGKPGRRKTCLFGRCAFPDRIGPGNILRTHKADRRRHRKRAGECYPLECSQHDRSSLCFWQHGKRRASVIDTGHGRLE